jgi:transcriptional repressor NF-X1
VIECGVVDHEIKRSIKCNNKCANIRRFSALYQSSAADARKPFYPVFLVRYAKLHPNFLKIENKIESMLKNGEENINFDLQNDKERTQAVEMLVEHHYGLAMDFYFKTTNPFVIIRNSPTAKLPNVKLSEYIRMIEGNEAKMEVLPFEVTFKFPTVSSRMDSIEDLELLLKEYKGRYYIEKGPQRSLVAVHFWEKSDATSAGNKLKKSLSSFARFDVEDNTALAEEQEKEKEGTFDHLQDLVIVSEKTTESVTEICFEKMGEVSEEEAKSAKV